jgi:hypothetical protein
MPRSRIVELYLYFLKLIHGVVLNYIFKYMGNSIFYLRMTSDFKTVNGVSTEEQIPLDAPSYAGSKEWNAEKSLP